MTSDTPIPGPDAPNTGAEPGRTLAAELLQGAAIPASTAAVAGPKLLTCQGD